jgi:hypothetical protein
MLETPIKSSMRVYTTGFGCFKSYKTRLQSSRLGSVLSNFLVRYNHIYWLFFLKIVFGTLQFVIFKLHLFYYIEVDSIIDDGIFVVTILLFSCEIIYLY